MKNNIKELEKILAGYERVEGLLSEEMDYLWEEDSCDDFDDYDDEYDDEYDEYEDEDEDEDEDSAEDKSWMFFCSQLDCFVNDKEITTEIREEVLKLLTENEEELYSAYSSAKVYLLTKMEEIENTIKESKLKGDK